MFMRVPKLDKHWAIWSRIIAIVITVGLLWVVFRRIDFDTLRVSLGRISWSWFALGFLAYGAALLFGSLRLHIAFRLTNAASHFLATSRIFLVGHFLFLVLFGAAGGDLARSTVYCRWYRFGFAEVLAASPLDRLLGTSGTIMLLLLVTLFALFGGSFAQIQRLPLDLSGVWLAAFLSALTIVALALLFLRPKGESFLARTLRTFRRGTWRLFLSPNLGLAGLAFATFAQLIVSLVFAINLAAITDRPIPWHSAFWVFPAITVLSCMPFTIAGIGTRELASIALLGMYGVPAADCAAASLLTLLDISGWAVIGAVVFWREELRVAKLPRAEPLKTITAVVPVLNEAGNLPRTIAHLKQVPELSEIIVVDGGSVDETVEIANQLGCRTLVAQKGRGHQLRAGAAHAKGDVVLLLHADSWLPPWAGRAILDCLRDPLVVAGGFWKRFHNSPMLLLGSRFKCAIRLLFGRRIAGDQAMFIRRSVLQELGGVPDMPLMEEFELCRRLRKAGRITLADATIVTSARRFEELGVVRTYIRMWVVTWLYRFGRPPHELVRVYNRGIQK